MEKYLEMENFQIFSKSVQKRKKLRRISGIRDKSEERTINIRKDINIKDIDINIKTEKFKEIEEKVKN